MLPFEGKVIKFNELKDIPTRNRLLNPEEIALGRAHIESKAPLLFLPTNYYETWLPEKEGRFDPTPYSLENYKLMMPGIIQSGERYTVIIHGIFPHFEVRCPRGQDYDKFSAGILLECKTLEFKIRAHKKFSGATMNGYEDNADFIRLYFSSLQQRKNAIIHFHERRKLETYHDDLTGYYKVVCRDNLASMTDWCLFKNYRYEKSHKWINEPVLHVQYEDWQRYSGDKLAVESLKRDKTVSMTFDIETDDPIINDVPQPESRSALMFDISMNFAMLDTDLMPQDGEPDQKSYTYAKPKGYLAMYTLTTIPKTVRPNRCTVFCKDEAEMILAFAIICAKMKPNYITGFNDGNYDWKWIVARAHQYGLLERMEQFMSSVKLAEWTKYKKHTWRRPATYDKYWFYRKFDKKISAENKAEGWQLAYPGYQCIDLMPQLRKLKSDPPKYGMNVFLKMYKLGIKVDMPIQRMFWTRRLLVELKPLWHVSSNIVARILDWIPNSCGIQKIYTDLLERSAYVSEYCTVDSAKCQDLLQKTVFVRDARALGHLTYVSMEDSVNRADGMKVRNTVGAEANQRGLRVSSIPPKDVEEGKYTGAHVVPPTKGVYKPRPTPQECIEHKKPGYDSVQPDDIREFQTFVAAHGIWRDKFTQLARDDFRRLHPTLQAWFDLPHHYWVGGLDFASLYPSLFLAYNYSPEMMVRDRAQAMDMIMAGKKLHTVKMEFNGRAIHSWSVCHSYSGAETEERNDDKKANFGIFPAILDKMKKFRKGLKKDMKPYTSRREQLEAMSPEEFKQFVAEYAEVMFSYNYKDSNQKAVKVLMNTFYGETGNKRSPLFRIDVAFGITASGQEELKRCIRFVTEVLGWKLHYGDTDSMYIEPPGWMYDLLDRDFYSGKILKRDYLAEVITRGFVLIKEAQLATNRMLIANNGTEFLAVEYEELLECAVLLGKKKYMGREHKGIYNHHVTLDKLFVRGTESKKKDTSPVVVKISNDMTWSLCDPYDYREPIDVAAGLIAQAYNTKHNVRDFLKLYQYRPSKNNVSVHTFVRRMAAVGVYIEPNTRFGTVIAKKYGFKYDVRGRKKSLSVGERMEYPTDDVVIDLDYYMDKFVGTILARMIHWCKRFAVAFESDADYKEAENKSMKAASVYLAIETARWSKKQTHHGPIMQKLFKTVNQSFETACQTLGPAAAILQICWDAPKAEKKVVAPKTTSRAKKADGQDAKWHKNNGIYDNLLKKLEHESKKLGDKEAAELYNSMISRNKGKDFWDAKIAYNALALQREATYLQARSKIATNIRNCMNAMNGLITKRDSILQKAIDEIKTAWNIESMDDDIDVADLIATRINQPALQARMRAAMVWNESEVRAIDQIDLLCNRMRVEAKFIYRSQWMLKKINEQVQSDNGIRVAPLTAKERKADLAKYKLIAF